MDLSVELVLDQAEPYLDPMTYRWLVGILDIAFVMGVLSQFLNSLFSRSLGCSRTNPKVL